MADVTELRCWPACLNAIDWSPEGIIALASDERVELLFPNTVAFDRDQDDAQWQHVPLLVPWFTDAEVPLKIPATLENYSIGEEISASAPIAIAWSPSGLSKHRRSALATLTANLVLSIWAADGKLQERSAWGRRLIVNDALKTYFLHQEDGTRDLNSMDVDEQLRLQTRIRAFAWAPQMSCEKEIHTVGSRLCYEQSLVAVCNDNNQLLLAAINSPTSSFGAIQSWNAKVLTHATISVSNRGENSDSLTFEDLLSRQRCISHVAWSPWKTIGGQSTSILAYATGHNVRGRKVTRSYKNVTLGDEIVFLQKDVRFSGPMNWSPILEDNDNMTLAVVTNCGLDCLSISLQDGSIVSRVTHDLDDRWDQVSGMVWDIDHGSTPRLHFSSLLSTIDQPTSVVDILPGGLTSHSAPAWRDQIQSSLVQFSAKNNLNGQSKVKVWGLAISPLGEFIASCTSYHPSDMIEYGSPTDRRGTVAISTARSYSERKQIFPAFDISAEGLLFTLKKMLQGKAQDTEPIPTSAMQIVNKLTQTYAAPTHATTDEQNGNDLPGEGSDLTILVQEFKKEAYFNPDTLIDRYTILVSFAYATEDKNELARSLIAYRLAKVLQSFPKVLVQSTFSTGILKHHQGLVSMIQILTVSTPEIEPADQLSTTFATDQCNFCMAAIPFTDLNTATCLSGHNFPRCGLSLLAIQAPGTTKYCGICNTPYLNEEFVAGQEHDALQKLDKNDSEGTAAGEDTSRALHRPLVTLAQVLFFACDACIYCGGKFVG